MGSKVTQDKSEINVVNYTWWRGLISGIEIKYYRGVSVILLFSSLFCNDMLLWMKNGMLSAFITIFMFGDQ